MLTSSMGISGRIDGQGCLPIYQALHIFDGTTDGFPDQLALARAGLSLEALPK